MRTAPTLLLASLLVTTPSLAQERPPPGRCTPGEAIACVCRDGMTALSACRDDGAGPEPCPCTATKSDAPPCAEPSSPSTPPGEPATSQAPPGEPAAPATVPTPRAAPIVPPTPVPPPNVRLEWPNSEALVAGGVAFAGSYGLHALIADHAAPGWAVPIFGAADRGVRILRDREEHCSGKDDFGGMAIDCALRSAAGALMFFDALVQGVGVATVVYGLSTSRRVVEPRVTVAPQVGAEVAGLVVAGRL